MLESPNKTCKRKPKKTKKLFLSSLMPLKNNLPLSIFSKDKKCMLLLLQFLNIAKKSLKRFYK